MSLRTVRCPRCNASVSIYMLNCDVCNSPIEEGKSYEWMTKSLATNDNTELYVLWALPNAVLKLEHAVATFGGQVKAEGREAWNNVMMYAFLWAQEQLKAEKNGALPTIAELAQRAEKLLFEATPKSHFGELLIRTLGFVKTSAALQSMIPFFIIKSRTPTSDATSQHINCLFS